MKYLKYIPLLIIIITFYYVFNSSFKTNINDYSINDYIISVVACEMPASYNDEAIKAQAVAARTFYYYIKDVNKRDITNDDQCSITLDDMKTKWGSEYNKYLDKIKSDVESTSNEVVRKENKLLKTYYFSTSNGYTNSSLSVFNETGISPVSSEFDKSSKDYEKEITYTKDELTKLLGNFNNIDIIKRDEHNNVLKVLVDNKEYSGIKFRSLLKLRSTDFDITSNNGVFNIITHGYGHGVGMSQYGASILASQGYNYKDILKYYYGDVIIDNY